MADNKARDWLFHYGFLVLAATPLLIYEIVAIAFRKTPTITEDTRQFIHTNWYIHVGMIVGFGLLMSHFFANWP